MSSRQPHSSRQRYCAFVDDYKHARLNNAEGAAKTLRRKQYLREYDEATSNLDTVSEQLIQASMATLLAGRTTFVIAHRLSTIRRADLILLMEDGCVVERGTHDELMQARGVYHGMVVRQMESDRQEREPMFG